MDLEDAVLAKKFEWYTFGELDEGIDTTSFLLCRQTLAHSLNYLLARRAKLVMVGDLSNNVTMFPGQDKKRDMMV